jgi:hypothetical protein
MILLVADLMELKADPEATAWGYILEAKWTPNEDLRLRSSSSRERCAREIGLWQGQLMVASD